MAGERGGAAVGPRRGSGRSRRREDGGEEGHVPMAGGRGAGRGASRAQSQGRGMRAGGLGAGGDMVVQLVGPPSQAGVKARRRRSGVATALAPCRGLVLVLVLRRCARRAVLPCDAVRRRGWASLGVPCCGGREDDGGMMRRRRRRESSGPMALPCARHCTRALQHDGYLHSTVRAWAHTNALPATGGGVVLLRRRGGLRPSTRRRRPPAPTASAAPVRQAVTAQGRSPRPSKPPPPPIADPE